METAQVHAEKAHSSGSKMAFLAGKRYKTKELLHGLCVAPLFGRRVRRAGTNHFRHCPRVGF
jgi:hypothetical protein